MWPVPTGAPERPAGGGGAPPAAPAPPRAAPAGGPSTSGPAPRSTLSSTRRISSCSPYSGVSGTTLSFRDVAALLLERGFGVTHETIREWECRFAPLWADRLRAKRRGSAGVSGSIDETSVQVAGRWCALDRARDRDGDLLDSMRSEHRDQHAARFCTAFDELRPYFRVRQRPGGPVPLVDKRQLFLTRWRSRIAEMTAVSTSRSWGTRCPALCVV